MKVVKMKKSCLTEHVPVLLHVKYEAEIPLDNAIVEIIV